LVAACGTAGGPPPAQAAEAGREKALAEIDQEIRRREERLRSLEARIAGERDREARERRQTESILGKLDDLAARLALEDEGLRVLDQRLRRSEIQLGLVRGRMKGLRLEQESLRGRLRHRLRQLYMGGPAATVRLLIMSRSVEDVLTRWSLATMLARYDWRLIEGYRRSERKLRELEAVAEAEVERRAALLARQAEAKKRIALLYNRRSGQLDELEKDKAKGRRLLREMEEARDALRDAIASLLLAREAPPDASSFGSLEGRLPWPVEGRPLPGEVESRGGRGLRIQAPEGAPIRPVAAGEIVFADWVRGYGHLLVLRHGGGIYTVYGGAGDVFVRKGQMVSGSEVIARVGTTDALGGAALYFEIRKGSIPLDPLRWLSPRP